MIGQTIEARPTFSVGMWLMLTAGVALAGWAVAANNPHPAIAAVLPLSLAVAIWRGRPPAVVAVLENDGINPFSSDSKIQYDAIRAVTVGGRRFLEPPQTLRPQHVEVHHDDGCLVVPPKLNFPTIDFYRFLISRAPVSLEKEVHPALAEYLAEQQAKFGPDKLHIVHAREAFLVSWRKRQRRWIVGATLFTGFVWFVIGVIGLETTDSSSFASWLGLGLFALPAAGIVYIVMRDDPSSNPNRQLAKHQNSCIVIGPAGLAMVQGAMQGALRWDEITRVTAKPSQTLRTMRVAGLQLRIRGGEIMVLDIYERSPEELESLIRGYLGD